MFSAWREALRDALGLRLALWYAVIFVASALALVALTYVQTDTILKKTLKSGSIILTPCTIAINENVVMQDGQINRCNVAVSGNNRITRYASA